MRSVRAELLVAGLVISIPGVGIAAPVMVNFESKGGFIGDSMTLPGATLTAGGGKFYVDPSEVEGFGGDQSLSSHSSGYIPGDADNAAVNPANYSDFRIDFGPQVASSFSIRFIDDCFVDCDSDKGYLQAFGAGDVLLGSINALLNGTDAGELALNYSAISYVVFWSEASCSKEQAEFFVCKEGAVDPTWANGVYWDDISYELVSEVPLPGTLGLLGIGLAGLGLLRRKAS